VNGNVARGRKREMHKRDIPMRQTAWTSKVHKEGYHYNISQQILREGVTWIILQKLVKNLMMTT
jgi:hypothetical protein